MIQTHTRTYSLHATIANTLVSYAQQHQEFRSWFATLAHQHLRPASDSYRYTPTSSYLMPNNTEEAEERALWLIRELAHHGADPETAYVLAAWADAYKEPQDVVLGVVGLAVIGPTLGLVKKKKKRKSQMRVVLSSTYVQHATLSDIVRTSQAASLGILDEALKEVAGDASRLDPQLTDWVFCDKETKLYEDTPTELSELLHILQSENLPHSVLRDGSESIRAIALHPQIHDSLSCGTLLD